MTPASHGRKLGAVNRFLGGTFAAFESRNFRVLWTGAFLAFIAFFMSLPVQSVVAFDLSGKNSGVGWVVAGQGVAQLVLNPFGGAMADRLPKRMVVFVCQAIITVTFLALALLMASDRMTVPLLVAGSFAIGAGFSFLGPARQGLMVELVGPGQRGNAVALSQVALNLSRVLAPLLAAGFLAVHAIGAAGAYFGMMALYVLAMVATYLMPRSQPVTGSGRNVLQEIASGLGYVARTARIRSLVPSYILIIAVGFAYTAVLPGLVKNELGMKTNAILPLLLVNAVGGFFASLFVASKADSRHAYPIYTGMCALFGVSLLAAGFAPNYLLLSVTMFFIGVAGGGFQTLNGALVSHLTEPAYFGRVVSLTFLAFAFSSIAGLPIGVLADHLGERHTIALSGGVVCGIVALYALGARGMTSSPLVAEPRPLNAKQPTGGE